MFSQAVLNGYLGDLWRQTIANIKAQFSLSTLIENNDGYIVGDLVPYNAAIYLDQAQFTFPILSAYRVSEEHIDHSASVRAIKGMWQIDWILPALEAIKAEQLLSFRTGVDKLLASRIPHGKDGYYTANPTWGTNAGIATVDLKKTDFAFWKLPTRTVATQGSTQPQDLYFPYVSILFEVVELEGYNNTNSFAGIDDGYVSSWDGNQSDDALDIDHFEQDT